MELVEYIFRANSGEKVGALTTGLYTNLFERAHLDPVSLEILKEHQAELKDKYYSLVIKFLKENQELERAMPRMNK